MGISDLPSHIAIVMDGNGRWAQKRGRPRFYGHKVGVERVREIVTACGELGVGSLTLFAFSTENWKRPALEVRFLMGMFKALLRSEVRKLYANGVRFRVVGDLTRFSEGIRQEIARAESLTASNTGLCLNIAANYGGRWDLVSATRSLCREIEQGRLSSGAITEELLHSRLSLGDLPEPDLFIRTGGEQRMSNFLLWQMAYTELYFTDLYWPDFNRRALEAALADYSGRQRRFGRTGDQVRAAAV